MRILPIALLALLSSNAVGGEPKSSLYFVKFEPRAASGACLPPSREDPRVVLRRNEIRASNARSFAVIEALASVMGTIEKIGGRTFRAHRGVEFRFGVDQNFSSHVSGTTVIHLNPSNENLYALRDKRFGGTNNRALLAHELAHYIAFRDQFAMKKRYEAAVPQPCHFTTYSADRERNEEFAEVFAAYITNPGLFSRRSDACNRARSFWAGVFREKPQFSESCATRVRSIR